MQVSDAVADAADEQRNKPDIKHAVSLNLTPLITAN